VNPTSLTFTPIDWEIPKMVTVTGVDDLLSDMSKAFVCITAQSSSTDLSYNGIDPEDVFVFNMDDELQAVAGGYHTVEVRGNGTLWAWGDNEYG
jgi:hypothetical protein